MAVRWHSTRYKGVRYREHPTRKNGRVRPDRYYAIRYQADGKRVEEGLGWESEGWSLDKAATELGKLREAAKKGDGPQRLKEKRELAEARRKEEEAEKARKEREGVTFQQFWDEHYWPLQDGKARGSRETELGLFNKWIKDQIGDKPLCRVAPFDLERIKANLLKAGRSPSTIRYVFSIFSQVWTLARRDGFVESDSPTRRVSLPRLDNRRDRFLTPGEAKVLLEAVRERSQQAHDMAVLALFAGLRFGEVAGLTWRDIDLERDVMTIRDPKARVNRQAFINKPIREVLERLAKDSQDDGLVFVDRKGKRVQRISRTFRRVADDMFNQGVTDSRQRVCFHTLRHSFASWLVENGTALYAVKELLGHSDLKMTSRYSHLAPEGLRVAAASVEGRFEEGDTISSNEVGNTRLTRITNMR